MDTSDLMLNYTLNQSGSSGDLLLQLAITGGLNGDGTSFQISWKKRSTERSSVENVC